MVFICTVILCLHDYVIVIVFLLHVVVYWYTVVRSISLSYFFFLMFLSLLVFLYSSLLVTHLLHDTFFMLPGLFGLWLKRFFL